MQRITSQRLAEIIARSIELVPPAIMARLRVDWLTEDPVWVGLHSFAWRTKSGALLRDCATYVPTCDQAVPRARRRPTITLPLHLEAFVDTPTVVHELGHALDEALGYDRPDALPVTEYAQVDEFEAFAEAFMARYALMPAAEEALRVTQDRATTALFDALEAAEL